MSDLFQQSNLSYWSLHVLNIHLLNARLVLTVQAVLIHHLVPVLILSHVLNVQPVMSPPILNAACPECLSCENCSTCPNNPTHTGCPSNPDCPNCPTCPGCSNDSTHHVCLTECPTSPNCPTCPELPASSSHPNDQSCPITLQPVLNVLFLHPVMIQLGLSLIQLLNVLIRPLQQHWCQ